MRRVVAAAAWIATAAVVEAHGTLLESLQSDDFVPYLGYEGPLRVVGHVGPLLTERFTQSFRYALRGVDPRCGGARNPRARDSCAVRIAQGVSCAKRTGGSFFGGAARDDPWGDVFYATVATSLGAEASGAVQVTTGLPHVDVEDRPVLVYDFEGARVACAMLRAMAPLGAADFAPFFTRNATTLRGRVAPVVTEHSVSSETRLSWELAGVEPACAAPGPHADSCGLRVHEGAHCLGPPGDRLFLTEADPWDGVTYSPIGRATVRTGYRQPNFEGRVVVLHDWNGAPAACAVLRLTPALEARFSRGTVGGAVGPAVTENHRPIQTVHFSLTGVDGRCRAGARGPDAASCGIRIHRGESCLDADRGPLFHAPTDARGRQIKTDPWAAASYEASSDGAASGALRLAIGRTAPELRGRVAVVSDFFGAPIGCAELRPVATVVAVRSDGTLVYGEQPPALTQLPDDGDLPTAGGLLL